MVKSSSTTRVLEWKFCNHGWDQLVRTSHLLRSYLCVESEQRVWWLDTALKCKWCPKIVSWNPPTDENCVLKRAWAALTPSSLNRLWTHIGTLGMGAPYHWHGFHIPSDMGPRGGPYISSGVGPPGHISLGIWGRGAQNPGGPFHRCGVDCQVCLFWVIKWSRPKKKGRSNFDPGCGCQYSRYSSDHPLKSERIISLKRVYQTLLARLY